MRMPSPYVLASLAVFSGCCVDALMKLVTKTTPVLTATGWRFILAAIFMSGLFILMKKPMPAWPAIRFHLGRSAAQTVSALAFFYALTQLALAEAVVLGFTAALMIAPMARVILGEKMRPATLIATFVGFIGAAIAATGETGGGPPDGNRLYGTIAIIVSALGYALCVVLLRLRSSEEDSVTLVTFINVFPALFLTPFMLVAAPLPAPGSWPILILIAAFGIGIWWLITLAYARAPAQQLAPFEFTALIYASIIGYVFFQETVSLRLFAGAALIIAACLYVAYDSHRTDQRARMPQSDIIQ